jgi:hypothetical protein
MKELKKNYLEYLARNYVHWACFCTYVLYVNYLDVSAVIRYAYTLLAALLAPYIRQSVQ